MFDYYFDRVVNLNKHLIDKHICHHDLRLPSIGSRIQDLLNIDCLVHAFGTFALQIQISMMMIKYDLIYISNEYNLPNTVK